MSAMQLAGSCMGDGCYSIGGAGSRGTPFWGGMETTSFKLLLACHILAVIIAFAPMLVNPILGSLARSTGGETGAMLARLQSRLTRRLFLPGLIIAALFGVSLVADSSQVYSMSDTWISAAFTIVIALALIMWFILRPSETLLAESLGKGEEGAKGVRDARTKIAVSTGIIHIGLLALIILMIWRPTS